MINLFVNGNVKRFILNNYKDYLRYKKLNSFYFFKWQCKTI